MLKVEKELLDVLIELKPVLRQEDHREATDEVHAGEYGLALEVICEQLYEYNCRISRSVYLRLVSIGELMEMSPDTWVGLGTLVD